MSYREQIYAAVSERFDERRKRNELEAEKRKKEAYRKIPELIKIEEQMRECAMDAVRAAIQGGGETAVRSLKKQSLELQAKRAEMLYSHGYKLDYLDRVYDCQKCRDTGYIGSSMCECFKKELKQERYRRSNLGAMLTDQTFKTFDLDFYSDENDPDHNRSPRENMKAILRYTKKFAEQINKGYENLLFIGEPGLGKTFLSTSIARTVMDSGFGVIYDTAENILSKYQLAHFRQDENAKQETEEYEKADLLIIDDLGAEYLSPFTSAALFNLINLRLISKKPLIVSTNLSMNDLEQRYEDRMVSRLGGEFTTFEFFGVDIRQQKLKKKAQEKENKNKKSERN